MTDPTDALNEETFEQRAAHFSAEVPEDAVTTDGFEWQTMRTILANAGMTAEVADWVFKNADFSFAEATGEESDEPDPVLDELLRSWGHGPERAHAITGALKDANLALQISIPEVVPQEA
jgi:hypothetical protein